MNRKREDKDTLKQDWLNSDLWRAAYRTMGRCQSLLLWTVVFLILVNVSGCSPQIPVS